MAVRSPDTAVVTEPAVTVQHRADHFGRFELHTDARLAAQAAAHEHPRSPQLAEHLMISR